MPKNAPPTGSALATAFIMGPKTLPQPLNQLPSKRLNWKKCAGTYPSFIVDADCPGEAHCGVAIFASVN